MPEIIADIAVGGMTCGACTSAVTGALENVDGVKSVNVSLVTERASVIFQDTDPKDLVTAVEDSGFDAELLSVKSEKPSTESHKLELAIEGMTCGSCTSAVTQAVEKLEGVESVYVSLATEVATIKYRDSNASIPLQAKEAVDDAGFEARIISDTVEKEVSGLPSLSNQENSVNDPETNQKVELKIYGMHGVMNLETIKKALEDLDGVHDVTVNLYIDTVTIIYDLKKTGIRSFVRCVESQNCTALVAATADNAQQLDALQRVKVLQSYKRDTVITFALGVPCIILLKFRKHMPKFLTAKIFDGLWVDDILGILMVLPILIGPARRFYVKSYKAVRANAPTMDVLVTTSVTCAFVYSLVALFHSIYSRFETHQMYLWDACAMILMFVLFGKYLENVARGHTSKALSQLISLVPENALVIAPDTSDRGELLATDMLQVGDIIILRPGERVGADGTVTEGESYISESLITGESRLVRKRVGDTVIGGTINGSGSLRFRVTSCGADTKLAQIVEFIKEAQGTRAPIQRYADYAAARFVPIILSLALITFGGWFLAGWFLGTERLPSMFQHGSLFFISFRLSIAVIVVACPCALGLATPTAVMVGTGVGAEHGILVKGGSIFEIGAHASVVLFDKTGTLTTGKMSVIRTTVGKEHWPKIRAIENCSEHPAGKAISSYYHPEEPQIIVNTNLEEETPTDVKIFPGEGIEGRFGNETIFVGRRRPSTEAGISVLLNNEPVGSIFVQDSLRSDAPAVIEMLKQQGMLVGIVSGDSKQAIDSIAQTLDIDEQYSWSLMRPEDKVNVIETLKAEGEKVVFVGDGINDTPALVSANVGVSLEGATHVAVESADIVLTQTSPIAAIPAALELCRATMRRIKTNLIASVVYNALMVPVAMGLFLPFHMMLSPMMASAAMASSSVSVVVSSLLLMRWQPKPLGYESPATPPRWWQRITQPLSWRWKRQERYVPV